MHCVGVDIIEIDRIGEAVSRQGDGFLRRIYTDRELELCRGQVSHLATRFAGKEAVMKVLGVGIHGAGWREIEILRDGKGAPLVELHGKALVRAGEMGLGHVALSLAHSKEYAVASAIGDPGDHSTDKSLRSEL